MKKFKTFYKTQKASRLKEIIQSPPDKSFLRLWNKNILTEIYRNIQLFAFQALRKSSSWTSIWRSANVFFDTTQKHVRWKICKVSFLAVFRENIFCNVERVEVRKMSEVFWAKLCCKMSDRFC